MSFNTSRKQAYEESSLDQYLKEISAYPFSRGSRRSSWRWHIKQGDQEALDTLVRSNLRFVVSVAKKYQNQGVALGDLINEGNLGLIRAGQKFDETKGIKFIRTPSGDRRQILAAGEQSRIVRVPLNRAGALHKIGKRTSALLQELGREPTPRRSPRTWRSGGRGRADARPVAQAHLSLDAPSPREDSRLPRLPPDQ